MPECSNCDLSDVKEDIKEIKEDIKSITTWFAKGQVRLTKDCLQNKSEGQQPVTQREFKRSNKLIWFIIGIIKVILLSGGGYLVAR